MAICMKRVADLHMAQLMPLPLTVSCFSKIQIGFTFLPLAHPGSPGKRAVKRVCVSAGINLWLRAEVQHGLHTCSRLHARSLHSIYSIHIGNVIPQLLMSYCVKLFTQKKSESLQMHKTRLEMITDIKLERYLLSILIRCSAASKLQQNDS